MATNISRSARIRSPAEDCLLLRASAAPINTCLCGLQAEREVVRRLTRASGIPLFGAWVTGDSSFLEAGHGIGQFQRNR